MTEQQVKLLEAYFGEAKGNCRNAMRMADYSDSTKVVEVFDPLAEEIEKRTRRELNRIATKAVIALSDTLDAEDILSRKDRLAAAKDTLDRTGFSKTEKIEVETKSPLFILPAKDA